MTAQELIECLNSNSVVKNVRRTEQKPFSEYEFISKDEFNSEEFRTKYENHFKVDGCMVSSSSEIIKELAKKVCKTEKATHLMVRRKFIKSSAGTQRNNDVIAPPEKKGKSAKASKETSCDDNTETENPDAPSDTENLESFCDSFHLEDGEIFETQMTKMKHRNKIIDKMRVKPGWSYKLGLFLFEKTQLSCKFDFGNIWATNDGRITTVGNCECKARTNITFDRSLLKVEIFNIRQTFPHSRVYQVRGERKAEIAKQLEHRSAKAIQTKLIN